MQRLLSLFAAPLIAGVAVAQVPVVDINTTGSGYDSNVDGGVQADNNEFPLDSFVSAAGLRFFTASSLAHGDELYRTDGTAAGTMLVKDINPGPASSNVTWLTSFFGAGVFFQANDGVNGTELWFSDGTATGTYLVKDINPTGNANPARLTVWSGRVWFAADDGVNGTEMWSSDTSPAGTALFADLRVGASSTPQNFTVLPSGTHMVFRCNDGTNGTEPWITDGTLAGTALLADVNPGAASSTPDGFVAFGSRLFFAASNAATGLELWSTDGTAPGTALVSDIRPGATGSSVGMGYATVFNGGLYFTANDGVSGTELWRTDGTTTSLVWDVAGGSGSSSPSDLRVHNGALYFIADDVTVVGRELRMVDALGATTTVSDIAGGSTDSFLSSGNNLTSWNGALYFKATNGVSGYELGTSDGTLFGSGIMVDIEAGSTSTDPDWFTPLAFPQMLFVADTTASGQELWITDGTVVGTQLLIEIDASVLTADGQPEELLCFNGTDFLFQARTEATGEELWKWDPVNGAAMVLDIRPGSSASNIADMTHGWLNGAYRVLFAANDGTNGTELWITDGTAAGTTMVADINVGSASSTPANLIWFAGRVYFSANDGTNGTELWATDGTAAGTVLVADIQVGANSSAPQIFCVHGGKLYFRANDGGSGIGSGNELWVTDGTAAGTMLVADIRPGSAASTPNFLTSFGGKLVFVANDGLTGNELWASDGTAAGTVLVADLSAGASSGNVQNLVVNGNDLFFRAFGGTTIGTELWKIDAALTNVTMFDLNPGTPDSNPSFPASVGGRLYFNATNGTAGLEPWVSDGTPAGTFMVADVHAGSNASSPANFTAASTGCYFTATTVATGVELWFTDGTAAGTQLVSDINFGTASSSPAFLTFANGALFFQADDEVIGKELFTISSPGAHAASVGHSGDGTVLTCTNPLIGQVWAWSYRNAPLGTLSARVLGLPLAVGSPIPMESNSAAWVDLAISPAILEFNVATSGGGAMLLPNTPALAGIRFQVQSLTVPPSILPFGSSNAMSMVLSN